MVMVEGCLNKDMARLLLLLPPLPDRLVPYRLGCGCDVDACKRVV